MSTTIVHLVRHGEVYNPDKILYGRMPGYHLSSRGRSQAARTARSFYGHDVTYLAASPLLRTQETAEPCAEVTGLDVTTDEDLIEAGNRFEGLRTKGWRSQLLHPVRWPLMVNPTVPSWGEPYQEILVRMTNAISRAQQAAAGHEAILVTHQLPIVTVQRAVAGRSLAHNPAMRQCELASVTSLVCQDNEVVELIYTEPAQEILRRTVTVHVTTPARRRALGVLLAAACAATVTACGYDEDAAQNAVAIGGESFTFFSPGGQQEIFYDAAERKPVGELSGPSVLDPDSTIALSDFAGQIVVINAWGQWCAPCRAEVDDLQQTQDALQEAGTGTVLGINVNDYQVKVSQDFLRDNGVTYPSIYDPPFKTALALGGVPSSVIPTTIILDRQHRPAAVFLRAVTSQDILDVTDRLAQEA